jgi:hypothetical protein
MKSTLPFFFAADFFNAVFVLFGFRRLFAPAGLCNALFLILWGLCHAAALGTMGSTYLCSLLFFCKFFLNLGQQQETH